ncbi:hypothetical protein cand_018530 [Cryptosporidium andersoni]|uniref:Uncharacterized protein n=1 Tax=Cryptosporidium andersoni TaxID=117008 RepID=A0A1J4M9W8_9CRYT|nr:hypothetical protein cand_018530 [Cryptosporidium andersoni]
MNNSNSSLNTIDDRPLSYILHKVLNILQSSPVPLKKLELQTQLIKEGVLLPSDHEFWSNLHNHERIFLDLNTLKYSYKSPYENIQSEVELLAYVRRHNDGLCIDDELLKANSLMDRWIRSLISKRTVRCLRQQQVAGRIRCKHGGNGSIGYSNGPGCPLWSQRPCEACANLKGIVLYPLAEDMNIEELKIDNDIRESWRSIIKNKGINLEGIIRQIKGDKAVKCLLDLNRSNNNSLLNSKRRSHKSEGKIQTDNKRRRIKIRNAHIFNNADELFCSNNFEKISNT